MKAATSWITYRTRFLVKAKRLTTSLTFTDVLGRQHCGSKGDYLVESSDGVLRIASRQIFEDVYVPLDAPDETSKQKSYQRTNATTLPLSPGMAHKAPPPHPDPLTPKFTSGTLSALSLP